MQLKKQGIADDKYRAQGHQSSCISFEFCNQSKEVQYCGKNKKENPSIESFNMLNLKEMVSLQNQTGEVILQQLTVLTLCYRQLPMPSFGAL